MRFQIEFETHVHSVTNVEAIIQKNMAKLTLDEWISRLKKNKSFNHNAAAIVDIPEKEGDWEDYPSWVNPQLQSVLKKHGMEKTLQTSGAGNSLYPQRKGCCAGYTYGQRQDSLL